MAMLKLIEGYTRTRRKNAEQWVQPILKNATDKGIKARLDIVEDDGNSLSWSYSNIYRKK